MPQGVKDKNGQFSNQKGHKGQIYEVTISEHTWVKFMWKLKFDDKLYMISLILGAVLLH